MKEIFTDKSCSFRFFRQAVNGTQADQLNVAVFFWYSMALIVFRFIMSELIEVRAIMCMKYFLTGFTLGTQYDGLVTLEEVTCPVYDTCKVACTGQVTL